MYEYHATVVKVLDGDTVDLDLDCGFHITTRQRFRLAGINAPEKDTEDGKAAKAYLESLIPVGSYVAISSQKPLKTEKYGRWLADIIPAPVDGTATSLSKAMVDAHHALPWDGKGARPV